MEFQLTTEQQAIYDEVESTNDNYFISGKPGVGKSVLINALRNTGKKNWAISAPTGIAALNIGGKTLHSLLGIRPSMGVYDQSFNLFTDNKNVKDYIKFRLHHLIIDEVSMLRCDMLDFIDRQLRHIKESTLRFGGVQVVFVGDFYQLPPVCMGSDLKDLKSMGYECEFAFSSKAFSDIKIRTLNKVLRQSDDEFLGLLHRVREGCVSSKDIKQLNKSVRTPEDGAIKLCATNTEVDRINLLNLGKLKGDEIVHEVTDLYGYWPSFPTDKVLRLKEGAQIMVKKNLPKTKLVNGTIAKLEAIDIEKGMVQGTEIVRARWEQKEKVFEGNMWVEKFKASFVQLPVQLAWAITMHKSQGQTFDKAHISPSRIFTSGQLYVALSRLRTLEGLTLESAVTPEKFKINSNVVNFYKQYGTKE